MSQDGAAVAVSSYGITTSTIGQSSGRRSTCQGLSLALAESKESPQPRTPAEPMRPHRSRAPALLPGSGAFVRAKRSATAKQEEVHFAQLVAVADGVILGASFMAAWVIRGAYLEPTPSLLSGLGEHLRTLWVILPSWLLLARRYGLHDPRTYVSPAATLSGQSRTHLIGSLVLLSAMFVSASWDVSRLLLQLFIAISFVAQTLERAAIHLAVSRFTADDGSVRNVLIVGADSTARAYARRIEESPYWRQRVVGFLAPETESGARGERVVGTEADLVPVLRSVVVDEVVAVSTSLGGAQLERIATDCAEFGVTFRTLVRMPDSAIGGFRVEGVGPGLYLMSVERTSPRFFAPLVKRAIDIVGSLIGLFVCGIVYLLYVPRLRRESPGPAFYAQERVGRNGRVFTLYKFRTMFPGADQHLDDLRAQNQMEGCIFKLREDPRVTPTGRLLRKVHLDELPQFWNVLRGEMSIVGTRPPTTDEVMRYAPRHHRRLSIKPGVTGLWQIAGNARVSDFETVVALDCEYIEGWSIWLDIRIVARTITKVLRAEGW